MALLGAAVNAVAVFFGAGLGVLCKKGIPERLQKALNAALALCVLLVGIQGALKSENLLVPAICLPVGALLGTAIGIDRHLNRFGEFLKKKIAKNDTGTFGEAFVNATLFTCVGAMAIVGAIDAGMRGSFETYFTKSLLDCVAVLVMAASLGAGCMLAGVVLFVYEGALTLSAQFLAQYLTNTMLNELTSVGSLLVLAIGLNLLGVTRIKVADMLPAVVLVPFLCMIPGIAG